LKGAIFDFNGTLLLDSHLHEAAWIATAARLREQPLTAAEFRLAGHGRTNKAIITYLQGREPDDAELASIAEEKESFYRRLCFEDGMTFRLAPGVPEFLDLLKDEGWPMTVATGSYPVNVDFYFQHLGLARWFDRSLVALDDGRCPGKPAPDIFLQAAEKLRLFPGDCLVFEDSYMGVEAAYRAGSGRIIVVEPALDRNRLAVPYDDILFCDGFTRMADLFSTL